MSWSFYVKYISGRVRELGRSGRDKGKFRGEGMGWDKGQGEERAREARGKEVGAH
jgi:hypothetical protein